MALGSTFASTFPERTLTVSSIANYDVQSFSTNKDEIDVLLLLKEKSNLLLSRPLSRIQSRKIFRASSVPAQKLVYRESRGDGFDGYFHALDLVSKLQRTKKLVAKGKAHEAKEKERTKYGQVAQVPNKLKWTFSWTEIKHPNLEKYLKDPTSVVNYKHMLSGELTELVDHLVAELFVYFRKGIPNYYMNKFLDKLVEDFPCFSDQSTCLGYVRKCFYFILPMYQHSFPFFSELVETTYHQFF